MSEAKVNEELLNVRQNSIRKVWGEPDSLLSGLYGDIYCNPEDSNKLIIIYYDVDTKTVIDVVFSDCRIDTDKGIYNIRYDLGKDAGCFVSMPSEAAAGETVEIRTAILFDADIHVYVDGLEIDKTHYDSDYWGYTFIMPEKDVLVTEWVYTKDESRGTYSNDLEILREEFPEYFGLSAMKGLEVYVWQLAPDSYSFGLLEATDIEKTFEELWNMKGANASQMRAILSVYDIDKDDIVIIPYQHPVSSYLSDCFIVQDNESEESLRNRRREYIENIMEMLLGAEVSDG